MDDEISHWDRLIHGLRAGDERIVAEFCAQYGDMMHRVAEKHLTKGVRQRVGPEDVAQSACRTFLRRAKGGEFRLTDSEELWRLLSAITLAKVKEQVRFHLREKRGVHRERSPAAASPGDSFHGFSLADSRQTPAEEAEFADQFRALMGMLNEEERGIVSLKLDDCTNDEAAAALGCSERTVRRVLNQIRARLGKVLEG